jgi:hypothetical protein
VEFSGFFGIGDLPNRWRWRQHGGDESGDAVFFAGGWQGRVAVAEAEREAEGIGGSIVDLAQGFLICSRFSIVAFLIILFVIALQAAQRSSAARLSFKALLSLLLVWSW